MAKRYEDLRFTDDFIFCKAMTEYPQLCEEVTGVILGRPVKIIKPPEKQKAVSLTVDGKGVRFDVYFMDDADTVYDIEMQTSTKRELRRRSRYYQGMMDLNLLKAGRSYQELPNSMIIFICLFDPFKLDEPLYTFTKRCEERTELQLEDGTKTIFINSKGDRSKASEPLRCLLDYLEGTNQAGGFTQKIDQIVDNIREQPEWRMEYMTLLERDREHEDIGVAKGIAQGLAKGLIQGRAEGLTQGRTEGLTQGRAEGQTEERIRTLKTLMANTCVSLDEAMRMLGVPISERELYLPYLS